MHITVGLQHFDGKIAVRYSRNAVYYDVYCRSTAKHKRPTGSKCASVTLSDGDYRDSLYTD